MRITFLIPGTGSFYCGSCLRDHALVRGLRRRGHDVTAVPLYLPMVLEEPGDDEQDEPRVLMGGINMYLQQKAAVFARLPRWVARVLDAPGLLRWSSARAGMTDPADLGDMTLSLLRGEHGRQAHELDELAGWLAGHDRPDLVCISNALLTGMVHRLKEAVDVPYVCTLQGEAPFLDGLPAPAREEAWRLVREHCADVDAFIAVSRHYGELMRNRLGLDESRLHVVHNGIDLDGVAPPAADPAQPTIGYLARLCPEKGLHTLVDAFITLRRDIGVADARLRVAGTMLKSDRPFVNEQRRRLEQAGLLDEVEIRPNIDRDAKWHFLASLSLLSVPATYGESFGLYVIEALAAGVPVVQPRHGAFPELLEATGGGVLCEPDDPRSLAEAMAALLRDGTHARALGERGRQAVRDRFSADRMAREAEKVCMMVASS